MNTTIETVYVESTRCNTYVGGKLGETKMFLYEGGRTVAAFVQLADMASDSWTGDMLYVTLNPTPIGDRGQHREVEGYRVITRDEFDDLTGLSQARRDMGWTE